MHYSPPSAAPVRDKISSAQAHAAKAKAALQIVGQALPLANAQARQPGMVALQAANSEIDALTNELLDSQAALKYYETKVSDQTDAANRAVDDKNEAIKERDAARAQQVIDRKHAHRLKLYICGALSVVAFLIAFQFRAILALLGPWGLLGGLAGLPAIAFAIAWKFF